MKRVLVAMCIGGGIGLAPVQAIGADWSRRDAVRQHTPLIEQVAVKYGLDACVIHGVVAAESNYDRFARSHAGALGLMQLMPNTAREMGVTFVYDPMENLGGGTRYLVLQLRKYKTLRAALWAYNSGPERVDTGRIPRVTLRYADTVIAHYRRCVAARENSRRIERVAMVRGARTGSYR